MFNKYATPDVEEEKARMKAIVDVFMNGEDDKENEEERTNEEN